MLNKRIGRRYRFLESEFYNPVFARSISITITMQQTNIFSALILKFLIKINLKCIARLPLKKAELQISEQHSFYKTNIENFPSIIPEES